MRGSVRCERGGDITGRGHVAGEMGVAAILSFDRLANLCRSAVGARKTEYVMARPRKSRGDFSAKAFGDAGDEQKRTGHPAQIQRKMLAMMAICASQPAVKASVRAAGIAAE